MSRRPGVTLLEVMIAIFVMAIGMLALLTLFPIGMLSMSKAIEDERCANIAAAAAGIANTWDVRGLFGTAPYLPPSGFPQDFEGGPAGSPWINVAPNNPSPPYATPSATGPSYALYVDPNGHIINGSPAKGTPASIIPNPIGVASGLTPGILRETVPYVGSDSKLATRWFSSLDDITFTPSGLAFDPPISTALINRLPYYSWAYLIKRPVEGVSTAVQSQPVDLWVVIYGGRSPTGGGENAYRSQNLGGVGGTALNVSPNPPADKPALRRNSWILDVTYDAKNLVHADFYRVVSAADSTDASGNPVTALEVIPPLKYPNVDLVVVMETVIQVSFRHY